MKAYEKRNNTLELDAEDFLVVEVRIRDKLETHTYRHVIGRHEAFEFGVGQIDFSQRANDLAELNSRFFTTQQQLNRREEFTEHLARHIARSMTSYLESKDRKQA